MCLINHWPEGRIAIGHLNFLTNDYSASNYTFADVSQYPPVKTGYFG